MEFEFIDRGLGFNCYDCGGNMYSDKDHVILNNMNLHDVSLIETLENALKRYSSLELEQHIKKLNF